MLRCNDTERFRVSFAVKKMSSKLAKLSIFSFSKVMYYNDLALESSV